MFSKRFTWKLGGQEGKRVKFCRQTLTIKREKLPWDISWWFIVLLWSAIRTMKFILCVFVLSVIACAFAEEELADSSARIAIKLYNDCNNDVGFSVCLKKKAISLLDRLGRMENVSLGAGINIVQRPDANCNESAVSEKDMEDNLPRALDAKEDALSYMLMDKLFNYVGSRRVELSLPKLDASELVEEGEDFVTNYFYSVTSKIIKIIFFTCMEQV